MPTMTADQIETSLKPMKDFAPAVLAAAEIVRAAQEAEKVLPKLRQEAQDLKTVMSHLADARAASDRETTDSRERARVALVAKEAAIAEQIAEESKLVDLRAQVANAEQEIQALHDRLRGKVPA